MPETGFFFPARGSYVVQVTLHLTMKLRMTLTDSPDLTSKCWFLVLPYLVLCGIGDQGFVHSSQALSELR